MIVDASAVLAVLLQEDDGPNYDHLINTAAEPLSMAPVNYWEICSKIIRAYGTEQLTDVDDYLSANQIAIAATDSDQAAIAISALLRYGKGRNHPANLNMGDCFAYALAKSTGETLLFKGDDFSHTDIEAAA